MMRVSSASSSRSEPSGSMVRMLAARVGSSSTTRMRPSGSCCTAEGSYRLLNTLMPSVCRWAACFCACMAGITLGSVFTTVKAMTEARSPQRNTT